MIPPKSGPRAKIRPKLPGEPRRGTIGHAAWQLAPLAGHAMALGDLAVERGVDLADVLTFVRSAYRGASRRRQKKKS